MRNIQSMIALAVGASGEPAALHVEFDGDCVWVADVRGTEGDCEVITAPDDWGVNLIAEGGSLETALAALDELCARHL